MHVVTSRATTLGSVREVRHLIDVLLIVRFPNLLIPLKQPYQKDVDSLYKTEVPGLCLKKGTLINSR